MPKKNSEEIIPPSLSPQKSAELFRRQLGQIDHLLTLDYDDPEVDKWENVTKELIIRAFGKPHGNLDAYHDAERGGPIWMGMTESEIQSNYLKGRENLRKLLEGFIEQLELFSEDGSQEAAQPEEIKLSKKVFIVHGHDDNAKNELSLILNKLGFDPVILHEQANEGLTLIEKLEKHSDVGYAFILLTPDDIGVEQGEANQKPRARQNVVFEFGLFVGKLTRNRVCCLYTGDVELPSDLIGLVYISYDKTVNERQLEIVKELRAAGYEVAI